MVQEVQTWVGITNETTLETIEAIGTSSFKIKEWRQTTGHYVSGCEADWNIEWTYTSWGSRDSWEIQSTNMAINEIYWKQDFVIRDYWVRVPTSWTYQIWINWGWWWSTYKATLIVKAAGDVVYQQETPFTPTTYSTSVRVDLWKFDTIEIRWQFYYQWSASSAILAFSTKPTLTIQQL